jgi:hypothetical protein
MTHPQRHAHPPAHPRSYPGSRDYPQPRERSRGAQVARVLLIVGGTMLVLVGLAMVAAYVFLAAAMSSFGSNK